jgi:hypothetical protein
MSLIDFTAKPYFAYQYRQLKNALASQSEVQQKNLADIILSGKSTEFGRLHGLDKIKSYRAFTENIPVSDYENFYPYIERMLAGEQNVLWPSIHKFSRSSGTSTGRSKFIPVSDFDLANGHIKTGKHYLSTFLHLHLESVFFSGKGIVLTGNYYKNEFGGEAQIADVSALLYKYTDSWINYFKALPLAIALQDDWTKKLDAIAHHSIPQNITNISGVATWILLLLRKVLEHTGAKSIAEVWPNLELIIHGGVDFAPYQNQFHQLVGKDIHYSNVYNSSEGFFAFQSDEEDNMLLDIANHVFYEFEDEQGIVVLLEQVQPKRIYNLIITNNSGLWRYRIGDVVEFDSLHPPKIRLVGRDKQCLNAVGEELIMDNTNKALAKICSQFGVAFTDYTVAPKFLSGNTVARHEWAIEFLEQPEDLAQFTEALDTLLRQLNSDYDAKRNGDLGLQQLKIYPVSSGSFYQWLDFKSKLGVQAKIPRLSNDGLILEEVLAISKRLG